MKNLPSKRASLLMRARCSAARLRPGTSFMRSDATRKRPRAAIFHRESSALTAGADRRRNEGLLRRGAARDHPLVIDVEEQLHGACECGARLDQRVEVRESSILVDPRMKVAAGIVRVTHDLTTLIDAGRDS